MAVIAIEGHLREFSISGDESLPANEKKPEARVSEDENEGSDTNTSDDGVLSSCFSSSSSQSSPMDERSEQLESDCGEGVTMESKFDGYVLRNARSLLPKPEPPPGVVTLTSSDRSGFESDLFPENRQVNRSISLPETVAVGKYIREKSSSFSAAIAGRFSSFRGRRECAEPRATELDLSERNKAIVKQNESKSELRGRITFFSRSDCRDSTAVRSFFREKRLSFVEINLDVYPEKTIDLVQRTRTSQVPQIFFNESFFGGLVALNSLRNSGGFDERLNNLLGVHCPDDAPPPPVYGFNAPTEEEEDEMAAVVRVLRRRLPIQDRLVKLRFVGNCFAGGEVVDVLIHHLDCGRRKATQVGKQLVRKNFIHHVFGKNDFEDGNQFYCFLEHGPSIPKCYNFVVSTNDNEPKSAAKIGLKLAKLMSAILDSYASDDRCNIDYAAISKSEEFRRYVNLVQNLHRINLMELSSDEKVAFFLNLYNAMVIHAVIRVGRPEGIFDRGAFSSDFQYMVGGQSYSLDAIKNGILRGNQRAPYSLVRPFGSGDKRAELCVAKVNPLIHFGLCDGTKSSPRVRFFSPQVVEAQLRGAARDFFKNGNFEVDLGSRTVYLTRIIKWSSADFGEEKDMVKWSVNYLDPSRAGLLMHLLGDGGSIRIVYHNYDWSVNS